MYQILKEYKHSGKIQYVLMVDGHSEILEFDNIEEAQEFCDILNANAIDCKYSIRQGNIIYKHEQS
jgi:hypothetical protein